MNPPVDPDELTRASRRAKNALLKEIKRAGFVSDGDGYRRDFGNLIQHVSIPRFRPLERDYKPLDLEIRIFSHSLFKAIHLVPSTGLWDSQICVSLSTLFKQKEYWQLRRPEEAEKISLEMRMAFLNLVLPLFDATKTDEQIVELSLQPQMSQKSTAMVNWEAKVFRGEATLKDRPEARYWDTENFSLEPTIQFQETQPIPGKSLVITWDQLQEGLSFENDEP